jgi:hypothetical protein
VIYSIVIYSLNEFMKMNNTKKRRIEQKRKDGGKKGEKKRGDGCLYSQRVLSVMQMSSNDGEHRHSVVVHVGIFVN